MFALRPVVALIALIGLTACESGDKAAIVMPEVTGRQLDEALADIKSAGFDDEVDVEGGGTFGVVDESNWTVCEQTPAAGKAIGDAPRLTVDRSCGDEAAEDTDEDTAPTSEPTTDTAAPETTVPAAQPALTAKSNADLAALLAGTDTCGESIGAFAAKYRGQAIEFDGSVSAMNNHADYDTRYDILVSYGDFSETKSYGGPSFQFRDVGISDLHLAGSDSIGVGANVHVVAKVGEFVENQCLFLLDPVTTTVR